MKDRYEDEIDFQWGKTRYDCSFNDEKGGKYFRKNPDGSITEFKPPALRIKTAAGIINEHFFFKVLKKFDVLKMESSIEAARAEHLINNNSFLVSRGVTAKATKRLLKISATDVVMETTYFAGKGPSGD